LSPQENPNCIIMKQTLRPGRRNHGFTLMEMLVVISIIVILAGITMGGFAFVNQRQAREQARIQIGLLQLALEDYHSDFGKYPEASSANGRAQTGKIYKALFPVSADQKVYLSQLDPRNDNQGWLAGQTAGPNLVIYDPWGTEYLYRTPGESGNAVNPDFDLWSAGPDGKTNATAGSYDPKHPDNLDDIRGW
jgi:type II secretion system protein G